MVFNGQYITITKAPPNRTYKRPGLSLIEAVQTLGSSVLSPQLSPLPTSLLRTIRVLHLPQQKHPPNFALLFLTKAHFEGLGCRQHRRLRQSPAMISFTLMNFMNFFLSLGTGTLGSGLTRGVLAGFRGPWTCGNRCLCLFWGRRFACCCSFRGQAFLTLLFRKMRLRNFGGSVRRLGGRAGDGRGFEVGPGLQLLDECFGVPVVLEAGEVCGQSYFDD